MPKKTATVLPGECLCTVLRRGSLVCDLNIATRFRLPLSSTLAIKLRCEGLDVLRIRQEEYTLLIFRYSISVRPPVPSTAMGVEKRQRTCRHDGRWPPRASHNLLCCRKARYLSSQRTYTETSYCVKGACRYVLFTVWDQNRAYWFVGYQVLEVLQRRITHISSSYASLTLYLSWLQRERFHNSF